MAEDIKEISTLTTPRGTYDSFPDKTARRDLAGKLPAPSTAQVGNLLRIKAVNGDGTFEVEAVRTLEGLGCNTLTLIDSNDGSGDSGTYIVPEGTAEAPVLVLYGLNGDEQVRISNVAKAEADRDVPTLGQVRELVEEAAAAAGGKSVTATIDGDVEVLTCASGAVTAQIVDDVEIIT